MAHLRRTPNGGVCVSLTALEADGFRRMTDRATGKGVGMRTLWVTALYLVVYGLLTFASACASHQPPAPQQKVWVLSIQASDTDLFCAQPSDMGEAWPQRCRQVWEVREFLGSVRAD